MKHHTHLSKEERQRLADMKAQGFSLRFIAKILGRSPGSLSREIQRNGSRSSYLPSRAHELARHRLKRSHRWPRRLTHDPALKQTVESLLHLRWSPEIIAGHLKETHRAPIISHEAIYQWLYKDAQPLLRFLVRHHPRRLPLQAKRFKPQIPQRISVHQRPAPANLRLEPGHWETDLLIGPGSSALQVLVERQTRFTHIQILPDRSAQAAFIALRRFFKTVPLSFRKTITYDNGSENFLHHHLNRSVSLRSYFCDPYSAWQKGSIENTNGLIRRFLPKRTDFDTISPQRIQALQDWLNSRPRKCLNFKTSAQVSGLGVAFNG